MQQEAVRKLDDQINLHTIVAPFDGYLTTDHCEIGQWLLKGAAVAEVVYLDEVDVEVQLAEDNVSGARVGAEARVEVSALPGEVFVGKVALVVPQANPRSRTFPVKIRVPNRTVNDQPLLKSNLFARVTLPLGKAEKATLVPKDAIVLGGPSPIVYVVGSDNKVKPVPVQLGVCSAGLIAVRAELKAGEQVVVQGNERLMPGATVAPSTADKK
jgi:RND family efflux transporter MFP subunit